VAALPHCSIAAVDNDPVLLAIGRPICPRSIEFIDTDVTHEGWADRAGIRADTLDAVVTSATLHYLSPLRLAHLYALLATRLRRGGLLLNADRLADADPDVNSAMERARAGHQAREIASSDPDWAAWWRAVADEPRFDRLLAERGRRGLTGTTHRVTRQAHQRLLQQSGFSTSGVVWSRGDDQILVAIR